MSLISIIAKAKRVQLSLEGEYLRLAELDGADYDKARLEVHERFTKDGLRVSTIDREVKKIRRITRKGVDEAATTDDDTTPDDEPWPDPVDLGKALDMVVETAEKFIAAPKVYFDIIALWTAGTHALPIERLGVEIMPQLGTQGDADSGKSTLLEVVATLAYRGRLRPSFTPATIFRAIHQTQATFALVDIHNYDLTDPSELKQIINSCHRRSEAHVDRCEQRPDGSWAVKTYRCWASIAWGSIGRMPQEIESRAILLPMKRATAAEFRALDKTMAPIRCPELITARRQFAAFFNTLQVWPPVETDAVNRNFDNQRLIYQVAAAAGGQWSAKARAAFATLAKSEHIEPTKVRLLGGIAAVFEDWPHPQIESRDLVEKLLKDEAEGWNEANDGKPINPWWLRNQLVGLLDPPNTYDWWENDPLTQDRRHCSGYRKPQFTDAFTRYLRSLGNQKHRVQQVHRVQTPGASAQPFDEAGEEDTGSGAPSAPDAPVAPDRSDLPEEEGEAVKSSELRRKLMELLEKSTQSWQKPASRTTKNPRKTATEKIATPKTETLDLGPHMPPETAPIDAATVIRALRIKHPNRSLKWIAREAGVPPSVAREVLGHGEGAAP